jgi:hypothetical protein
MGRKSAACLAVALGETIRGTGAERGAGLGTDFHLYQSFGGKADQLAQNAHVGHLFHASADVHHFTGYGRVLDCGLVHNPTPPGNHQGPAGLGWHAPLRLAAYAPRVPKVELYHIRRHGHRNLLTTNGYCASGWDHERGGEACYGNFQFKTPSTLVPAVVSGYECVQASSTQSL